MERELRDFARLQVRAGLLTPEEQYAEVSAAVAAEMPHTDASVLARAWLAAGRQELVREQRSWPETTDHDRLVAAFAECEAHGVPVRQGVDGPQAPDDEPHRPRGIAWFAPADVWHAVDTGVLAVDLRHGDGTEVAADDPLLHAVRSCLERHGLRTRSVDGRVEVAARWQRRLVTG